MTSTPEQYQSVMKNCNSLFAMKMTDYGSAWRILRLPSLTDQIFIKAQRIRGLQTNATQKVDEGEVSEFIGVINYSLMALIQIELGVSDTPDLNTEEALLQYEKQAAVVFELMKAKNHDYGEAWRDMRISSLTDLILQKLMRVKQIEGNDGKEAVAMVSLDAWEKIKQDAKAQSNPPSPQKTYGIFLQNIVHLQRALRKSPLNPRAP